GQFDGDETESERRKVNQRTGVCRIRSATQAIIFDLLSFWPTEDCKHGEHAYTGTKQPLNHSFGDRPRHSPGPIYREIEWAVIPNRSDKTRRLGFVLLESLSSRQHVLDQWRGSPSRHDDGIGLRPLL